MEHIENKDTRKIFISCGGVCVVFFITITISTMQVITDNHYSTVNIYVLLLPVHKWYYPPHHFKNNMYYTEIIGYVIGSLTCLG